MEEKVQPLRGLLDYLDIQSFLRSLDERVTLIIIKYSYSSKAREEIRKFLRSVIDTLQEL